MLLSVGLILIGTLTLWLGAEVLVKGAVEIAQRFNVPAFWIGITILAFGTSLPELVTSLLAHVQEGRGDIALGNILGSNVANFALVLGGSALLSPILISKTIKTKEMPLLFVYTILLGVFMFNGDLTPVEGGFLLVAYFVFLLYPLFKWNSKREVHDKLDPPGSSVVRDSLFILLGIILLPTGSHFLLAGAIHIAEHFGYSDRFVGLTLVAVGTSAPELATTIVAALKKQGEMALGNVVGSNFINIAILGFVVLFKPLTFSAQMIRFDYLCVLLLTLLMWFFVIRSTYFTRLKGTIFLGLYAAYIYWLVAHPDLTFI